MTAVQSPWPEELDALVAAPAHHALVLENDRVRVLDAQIAVDSREMASPMQAPLALWTEPVPPHSLENVGDGPIHAIAVELKA